jgi:hypothetical protein
MTAKVHTQSSVAGQKVASAISTRGERVFSITLGSSRLTAAQVERTAPQQPIEAVWFPHTSDDFGQALRYPAKPIQKSEQNENRSAR